MIPIDSPIDSSYYVLDTFGPRRKAVDGDFEPRRSIFDIVYQTTSNGTARRPDPPGPARPKEPPVNFLYMGSFLRFKKVGRQS